MTKTMDSFLDGHTYAMTQNNMPGFDDELMTPVIDPELGKKTDQQISTWIDSSHLNIGKDDDYFADDSSAILLPSSLNSPPDSVKSQLSNDDADCSTISFNNNEKSFDFINENDTLNQPMKNSQDLLYPGAIEFHQEIENLCNEEMFNTNSNTYYSGKDYDNAILINDEETPIVGNDLMFGRLNVIPMPMPIQNGSFDQNDVKIKCEPVEQSETMQIVSKNMESVAPAKLLARRAINPPQLKLKIKLNTNAQNGINIEAEIPNNNKNVISTPQLTKEILEMEDDLYDIGDLVNYIDSSPNDVPTQTIHLVDMNKRKQDAEECVSIPKIEQILPTPVASPKNNEELYSEIDETDDTNDSTWNTPVKRTSKRRRISSTTTDCSEIQAKRPRGRPPKTGPDTISPAQLKRLNSSERKHLEQRIKNNEASRKSRLNRKDKENTLFVEYDNLLKESERLTKQDKELDREIAKWKKRVLKLAMH